MYLPIWFLIALTFWLRIGGSLHDGLSDRGRVQTIPDTTVGWISWHVLSWMRRDIVIVVIYALLAFPYVLPAVGTSGFWTRLGLTALAILTLVHKFLHNKLYWWAFYHREKFLRGPA